MYIKKITLIAILFIGAANCQSWKIFTNDGSRYILNKLSKVKNDTLFIKSDVLFEIPVEIISSIGQYNTPAGFGIVGALGGGALVGTIGFFTSNNYENGFRTGFIIGAVGGGLIFSRKKGKYYNLNAMTTEQKIDTLNKVIEKYTK